MLASFGTGRNEVLIFERMRGQFYESFFNFDKFLDNARQVEHLKTNLKNKV